MANDKNFKVKNDIQAPAYYENVGTISIGSDVAADVNVVENTGNFLDVSGQETGAVKLTFKPGGTQLFVLGTTGDDINEYTLSTAWDLSTASYTRTSISLTSADGTPYGIVFKPDGTKVFILGGGTDEVNEFALSTAWDISVSSLSGTVAATKSVTSTGDTQPRDLAFKPDGTEMFILGYNTDRIYKYTLSTAWDLSDTITLASASLDIGNGNVSVPIGMTFNSDGTRLYVCDAGTNTIDQYNLSTAYDITTATYKTFGTESASSGFNFGITIGNNDKNFYTTNSTDAGVYQLDLTKKIATLDLSTGSVFELTPTSSPIEIAFSNPPASGVSSGATLIINQDGYDGGPISDARLTSTLDVSSETASPFGAEFSSDGTKFFTKDFTTVYRYSLTTPFDLSTASADTGNTYSFTGQSIGNPYGFRFGNSGTKLYIVAYTEDKVYQYTLSTAYDLSGTVTYNGATAALAEETGPYDLDFNGDGTKMFITGIAGDDVEIYNLGTAWDITGTVTHDSTFTPPVSVNNPQAMRFNSDGTIFYIQSNQEVIHKYNLSTAYDLSTATLDRSGTLDLFSIDNSGFGIATNNDDTKLYFSGASTDKVYEFTLGGVATIVYDDSIKWAGGSAPYASELLQSTVSVFNTTDGGTTYNAVAAIEGAE